MPTLTPTQLAQARAQAVAFFDTPVSVYNLTITFDGYGKQIIASGLLYAVTGYVGKVSGKDTELLTRLGLAGTETDTMLTVLVPFENQIQNTNIVVTNGKQYHVIWHNDSTQNVNQLYTKAICIEYSIEEEKKRYG
jgi:hypothetical protein